MKTLIYFFLLLFFALGTNAQDIITVDGLLQNRNNLLAANTNYQLTLNNSELFKQSWSPEDIYFPTAGNDRYVALHLVDDFNMFQELANYNSEYLVTIYRLNNNISLKPISTENIYSKIITTISSFISSK